MADAAISTLVQLLGDLLVEKGKFLGKVVGEVQLLKDKLEWMQGFLQHAEEKQATDVRVRKWISEIREVAFDAEDVIQIFILNVDNPRKTGGLLPRWACFPCHVSHLDRVGQEIQGIWIRLDDIEKNCAVFGIEDLGPRVDWTQQPNHVEWRRRLNPTQKDTDVVGLEKDVQSLLEIAILDDNGSLSAATVVGMGGIGKSTLAKIVYNHDDVVRRFDLRAWVVVSNEFKPRQIFKDLLLELLEPHIDRSKFLEEIQHENAPELQRRLRKQLMGKRYLIVLDDVWEEDHWACFDNAFPNDGMGSRLLITSRNHISIKSTQYTHRMSTLDDDKSWKLFLKKSLPDNTENKCPKDLEDLGREMVEKCGGLPLAINVVGGLLLKEGRSKSGWMKISKQIKSHLGRDDRIVFHILELSYQTLLPRLKPCFLCLSFFKEDATIRAVKLENIWISLGYIRQEGEESVEAIARRYLEELVSRNLIQVKDISSDGYQIKNCQVHDLIREVSITKAKEEMGLEMLGGKGSSSQQSNKPRHCALYTPLINGDSSRNKHLRSLFVYTNIDTTAPSSYWKSFELLKILDLEECWSLRELPEAISALIGLTYLGLKSTRVGELPRSIRKLKNLEVIELQHAARLPRSVLKLINLRHIDGKQMYLEVPKKVRPLKNIRRLKGMVVGGPKFEQDLAQITAMPNLSYLSLFSWATHQLDFVKLFNSLNTLENLVRLTLTQFLDRFPVMEGLSTLRHVTHLKLKRRMTGLPTEFPPNVAHLTLTNNGLTGDPMPVLEKLPCLLYLHLQDRFHDDACQEMVISSDGFSKLEILKLTYMPHLERILVGGGAMPELKRVEIRNCFNLNTESLMAQLRPSVVLWT